MSRPVGALSGSGIVQPVGSSNATETASTVYFHGEKNRTWPLWDGITPNGWRIGDAQGVFELLWLLLTTVLAWVCPRPLKDLVLENLLLRHQLAVLTRPTRTRPRPRTAPPRRLTAAPALQGG